MSSAPWEVALALTATLIALFGLNSWIGRHVQGVGLLAIGHSEGSMVLAWLIFLPGVALHEASHWLTARILGLRPSKLRIWPERRGKVVRMGYVDFRAGGTVRESLVGLAPLLSGGTVLLWIAAQVFGLDGQMNWSSAVEAMRQGLGHADIWLYSYLIFAISNGMMPSASDRQAWGSLLLYIVIVTGGLYALDLVPSLSPETMALFLRQAQLLTYALGLAVTVDLAVALGVGGLEWGLSWLRGRRVLY